VSINIEKNVVATVCFELIIIQQTVSIPPHQESLPNLLKFSALINVLRLFLMYLIFVQHRADFGVSKLMRFAENLLALNSVRVPIIEPVMLNSSCRNFNAQNTRITLITN